MRQVLTARNATGEASAEVRLTIRPDPKKIRAGKQRALAKRMADQKVPFPRPLLYGGFRSPRGIRPRGV